MENAPNPDRWPILFDLNVLLDVLIQREPHFGDSAKTWALAESGELTGYIAAHSFSTLFYLYSKHEGKKQAANAIRKLLKVFQVALVDQVVILEAVQLGWDDFEDAMQAISARRAGCDYLLTRNPKDYRDSPVPAIQPADFLAVWSAGEGAASR